MDLPKNEFSRADLKVYRKRQELRLKLLAVLIPNSSSEYQTGFLSGCYAQLEDEINLFEEHFDLKEKNPVTE